MEITKKEPEMVPYLALLLSAVLAFLDQMVKVAVYNWLRPVGDLPLIEGVITSPIWKTGGWPSG